MWNTLINLLEKWWKDKPRRDLLRAIVGLKSAMILCQQSYHLYEKARKKGRIDSIPYPNPRDKWTNALTEVGVAVAQLGAVLSIFSPEALRSIHHYLSDEFVSAETILGVAASELGEEMEINVQRGKMQRSFEDSLNRLNEFIRTNFKPEELHAVQKEPIRRWI